MRIIVGLLMAMLALPAMALTLSWEPPGTRVDGSAFSLNEVGKYEVCISDIENGDCLELLDASADQVTLPVNTVLSDYKPKHFRIRVYDTEGQVSDWSNSVRAKLVGPPTAPTLMILPDG